MAKKRKIKNKKTKKSSVRKKKTIAKRKAVVKKKKVVKRKKATRVRKAVKRPARRKPAKRTGKTRAPIGGMAFANGLMLRTKNNMVLAMADNSGGVEVVDFKLRNLRDRFPFLFAPFIRGIFFFIENIYFFLKISWFKRPFIKKSLRQKPRSERIWNQLHQYLIYGLYFILAIGFFDYLYVRLNSGIGAGGTAAFYSFLFTLLYIFLFVALFFLVSLGRRDEIEIFAYHGAEHKIIDAYQDGEAMNIKNVKRAPLLNSRCSLIVSFWALVLLAYLVTFLKIQEANWIWGLSASIGLLFISFSFAYEVIKFIYLDRLAIFFDIFIRPIYLIQSLLVYPPEERHLKVGLLAYEELMRIEKEK